MFTPHPGACAKTMEHARKRILIPEESINNLQQHFSSEKVTTMQTPGTPVSRLDNEMSKIINSTSIRDDREKYVMYQQALDRFMYYKKMIIQSFK